MITSATEPKLVGQKDISAAEWKQRVELAALYRILHLLGMTDLIYNHVTAEVPGEEGLYLINSYGLAYDEVTASSLYKIDIQGNVVAAPNNGFGLNTTGYVIHGAIHRARPDLKVLIHTHSRAGSAVSAQRSGLLPLSQQAALIGRGLAYHAYEGPALDAAEGRRLIEHLGDCDMMILKNHGLIAGGRSVSQAFLNIYRLESACQIQVDALSAGSSGVELISDEALEYTEKAVRQDAKAAQGELEWRSLLRRLDRLGGDYAT